MKPRSFGGGRRTRTAKVSSSRVAAFRGSPRRARKDWTVMSCVWLVGWLGPETTKPARESNHRHNCVSQVAGQKHRKLNVAVPSGVLMRGVMVWLPRRARWVYSGPM